jgi:hypothetical protein
VLTWDTSFGTFAVVALVAIFMATGLRPLARALTLRKALRGTSIVRAVGPVQVTERAHGKSRSYRLHLDNNTELNIDKATHDRLAMAAELRSSDDSIFSWEAMTGQDRTLSTHELASATVTYEPTAPLLLEILGPDGATLYRDEAVSPSSLDAPPAE